MSIEIVIPQVGATGGDVRILTWLVRPGDFVTAGTPLVTIETDKATEDIEAFSDGCVDEILAEAGSDVPVGSVIATLREDTKSVEFDGETKKSLFAESDSLYQPSLPSWVPEQLKSVASVDTKRIFASPAARQLAHEKNVDLSTLSGGGESRTIHLAHVEQAILSRARKSSVPNTPTPKPETERTIRAGQPATDTSAAKVIVNGDKAPSNGSSPPANRIRRAIAERVSQSKHEIPHFYMSMTVDMTDANLARTWLLKASQMSEVVEPTINDLIVRATALALRDTPRLNALYRNNSVESLASIDVGIVVGTEDGVLVPIVSNVDQLDVYALAEATRALKLGAQEGKLTNKELKGGAISVSNLGMYGVESFTAIIDPAQSSILACGAVKQTPAVCNGEVVVREHMTVTLSVDHRVADGVLAAKFLNRFKHYLEIPQLLITGKGSDEK